MGNDMTEAAEFSVALYVRCKARRDLLYSLATPWSLVLRMSLSQNRNIVLCDML
jgi:hypothetical protein